MTYRHILILGLVVAGTAVLPVPADGQILDRMRRRAEDRIQQRVENAANNAVDRAIDRTEEGIRCVFTDENCIRQAKADGKDVVYTDAAGGRTDEKGAPAPASALKPGDGAWANFDFVTGDRTLFTEDFSRDRVGNFPRRLEMRSGSMEIVEWQGGTYLRGTAESSFDIVLPEALPERFTIEFDLFDPIFWATLVYAVDPARDGEQHTRVFIGYSGESGLIDGALSVGRTSAARLSPKERMMRVSIMADGAYMKVFLDEARVSNMPNASFPRTNRIRFELPAQSSVEQPVLIGNIRIAAGGTSLYDALEADGRVSTQGILFATGSDQIRPESTPTLKEIGEMLKQHGDLRLIIEGHTDATGGAAANQQLSERRAAAVRQHLITSFGIDAARLQSVGKGQSEPADSNDTPEGRQNNRRVVLVRQ
jgi:OmpA-OmpF porin, OOP family